MASLVTKYGKPAIVFHWLTFILVLSLFPMGGLMKDMPISPEKLQLYSIHKWIGITVFLLTAFRLTWRATHPVPQLPTTMPAWQRSIAGAIHTVLYILLFAIPISGWLMSSAKGVQTVYLGLVPLPDLVSKDQALGELLGSLHDTFALTLGALVITHVAAALKHHLIDRDDVLPRMLPFLKVRK